MFTVDKCLATNSLDSTIMLEGIKCKYLVGLQLKQWYHDNLHGLYKTMHCYYFILQMDNCGLHSMIHD